MTMMTPTPFPADLRLWRAALRISRRGYGLARRLWLKRLNSLGTVAVPTKFGFMVLVDPTDYHGWSLAMQGDYEPPISRLVCRELRPGDVFADVGANHGWFSLLAAQQLRTNGGRVFAFEPQTKLCTLLRASAELNRLDNLSVIQAAAGEGPSRGVVYVPRPEQTRYGSLFPGGKTVEAVDIVPLDDALSDAMAALVKIDVEGFEIRVLRGMKRLLRSPVLRALIIEVHPAEISRFGDELSELVRILSEHGFRLYRIQMGRGDSGAVQLRELESLSASEACANVYASRV
jgi:FkbM family methyltransferase